jgi:hypothetical protein
MKVLTCPTHVVYIYVAGQAEDAKRSLSRQCLEDYRCVFVESGSYIYPGAREEGVKVTLVNYPRYPASQDDINERAMLMASVLIRDMYQHSAMIVTPTETVWVTHRHNEEVIHK